MFAHSIQPMPQANPTPQSDLPDAWRGTLNALRFVALTCRAAPKTDLFEACALIATRKQTGAEAFATALLRCLPQAIGKRPVFYQPGTADLSFDEKWLMRAVIAANQADGDSLAFLIRSRVTPENQRNVSFLIKGISDNYAMN